MKNKMGIVLISLLMLSLAACGTTGSNTASADPSARTGTVSGSSSNAQGWQDQNSQPNGSKRGNGGYRGQLQGQGADLTGEVSSISGNQITLKVIKMPAFNRNGTSPRGGTGNSGNTSQPAAGSTPAAEPSSSTPASDSSNTSPDSRGPKGNGHSQPRGIQYTGETKTVTIPDGVAITAMARTNGDSNQQTLKLSDIKEGNVLQIWYSDKDKGTVSKINVMQRIPGTGQDNPSGSPRDSENDNAE